MMRLIAPLALLMLAALFGWLAAAPLLAPVATTETLAAVTEPDAAPLPPLPTRPQPVSLTPFTDRPLFSAARRPPPPKEPGEPIEDPMANMLFGRYEIAGVVQLGDKAVAMLRDMRDGTLLRIREGDRVGDADVVEITLESLTFSDGGATVVAPVAGTGAEDE